VRSAHGEAALKAELDPAVADGALRISTAFAETLPLGSSFGEITVERA